MDISKIVFGEQNSIDVPVDDVTSEGIVLITEELRKAGNDDMKYHMENGVFWPDVWSWRWTEPHGAYVGNLPKRIQSLCYKRYRRQLPPDTISAIGNIARANTNQHTTWVYDFDKELSWNVGEFGDTGSCFWTEKPWCLPLLKDMGGFAIRVYDPEKRTKGIGRGLIIAYDPIKESGKDPLSKLMTKGKLDEESLALAAQDGGPPTVIVFNGYGQFRNDYVNERGKRYGHMQSMDYARLMAQILGQSYHKTTFTVNGKHDDPMFINNEGTSSFLVGPDPLIRQLEVVNISVEKALVSKHKQTCTNCGRGVGPLAGKRQATLAPDGSLYCYECFYKIYVKCYGCVTVIRRGREGIVQSIEGNFQACSVHFVKIAKRCQHCGECWAMDEISKVGLKKMVCPNCIRNYTRNCWQCRHRFVVDDMIACKMPEDPTTEGRAVRVCAACLKQEKAKTKKNGTAPKYLALGGLVYEESRTILANFDMAQAERRVINAAAGPQYIGVDLGVVRQMAGEARQGELLRRLQFYENRLSELDLPLAWDEGDNGWTVEEAAGIYEARMEHEQSYANAFGSLQVRYSDRDLASVFENNVRPRIERWAENQ